MTHLGPIAYTPSSAGIDTGEYDLSLGCSLSADAVTDMTISDLAELSESPEWSDRIRAEWLRDCVRITLPDQFPCIYEPADSPHRAGAINPKPFAWVTSPDIAMLSELLPTYQELWDNYTAQWGQKSRRTFSVGRLDGLSPRGVCRPGTTALMVIGATMLTHSSMYQYQPETIRRMHPLYKQWNRT